MNVLAVISPGLKVLFERVGKPEVINRPEFLRFGRTGAVIACNHVDWADSLWMAYAVYPRQLRYMSKQELFGLCAREGHSGSRNGGGGALHIRSCTRCLSVVPRARHKHDGPSPTGL